MCDCAVPSATEHKCLLEQPKRGRSSYRWRLTHKTIILIDNMDIYSTRHRYDNLTNNHRVLQINEAEKRARGKMTGSEPEINPCHVTMTHGLRVKQ